jgi:hypothetical protein
MARINEILEPGERIVMQHWPRQWVYSIVGLFVATDLAVLIVVGWVVWASELPDAELLLLVMAGFVVLSLALLPLMVGFLRLAVITDRRVLVRDGMTWSHPKHIRRSDIEGARQNGGKFEIHSITRTVEFPCPPQLASGIFAALGRNAEGAA